MALFEKLPEIRQREIVRDPIASVPVVIRGDGDMPVGIQVPRSSHQSIFLRLGKQVLLDNQTEGVLPKDVVTAACHPAISQGALSSASVIGILWWRYPRISPEYIPLTYLEGKRRNYEFSLDPPERRPTRLPTPLWHRKGEVEDRSADPRRVKVQRRVEDHLANPRIA